MNEPAESQGDRPESASFLSRFFKRRPAASLRTVIEDYIEKSDDVPQGQVDQEAYSHALIANVLKLTDLTAFDVMVPRAEIDAIPHDITRNALIEFVRDNPHSRFPVYKDSLDEIIGTVHIKDLFLALAPKEATLNLSELIREVSIISPALPVIDVLHEMRVTRRPMMMVVDEFGGIDGLVTAGDVIEAVIGHLEDEHDNDARPELSVGPDGTSVADGKLPIDVFEAEYGEILTDEERETVDTLGGYVMTLAGRIPARGEVIEHESGIEFTVLDADPRSVHSILIRRSAE